MLMVSKKDNGGDYNNYCSSHWMKRSTSTTQRKFADILCLVQIELNLYSKNN